MSSFCFVVCVYDEWELASRLIKQLLANFPCSEKIVLTDGTNSADFRLTCLENNIRYIATEQRLLEQKYGSQWLTRLLGIFNKYSKSDYLVRLDADCWVNRSFQVLPHESLDIGGTLQKSTNNYPTIQGGCYAVKRDAARNILKSSILDDIEYTQNPTFAYKRYQPPYVLDWEKRNDCSLIAEDSMISHAAHKLGLSVGYWHDIYSQLRGVVKNPESYAIIHPVKQQ